MVKLQDSAIAFSTVVSDRRGLRASQDAERFRLGLHGLDCTSNSLPTRATAVIGASAWALKAEQVDHTVQIIGRLGGLLADLGFQVCPVGADATRTAPPSLMVWVCGDETQADEYEQLKEIGAPGLSIGSCVDGLDDWDYIETEVVDRGDELTRRFVDALDAMGLLGAPETGSDSASRIPLEFPPSPASGGGTSRDQTASLESATPGDARRHGTRRDRSGRGTANS